MQSDEERCAEYRRFLSIDAAFREGNLAALKAAVDDPESVANGPMPLTIGPCLEYAIYHSPLSFIENCSSWAQIRTRPTMPDSLH